MNAFFHDFGKDIIRWRARIVMGDASMGCHAVEDVLAYQGLSASLLAFHAEYVQPKDVIDKPNTCLRQLTYDSCAIWSIGPIENITRHGPAKHCLTAALWPQRVDGRGTFMGCVQKSYRRVVPHSEMTGKHKWPHLTEDIFQTCQRWKARIAQSEVRGGDKEDDQYREAPADLIREYVKFRKSVPSIEVDPREGERLVPYAVDTRWPCIKRSWELMSDWRKADPHANQWSKGGHWVLKVVLTFENPARDRGEQGRKRMAIVKDKKEQWMDWDVWPWWIESDTEAHHWSAKIVGLDR